MNNSNVAIAPGASAPGMTMEQDPMQRVPETGQPTPETGRDIAINILDPNVPFNKDGSKPVMATIYTTRQEDGTYTGINGETVHSKEVADDIAGLLVAARGKEITPDGVVDAQNGDMLEYTDHEKSVMAHWEAEKAQRKSASEVASAEDEAGSGSKGLSVGKVAAGIAAGTGALFGLGAVVDTKPVEAQANHNLTLAPLTAEPFSISSKENLVPGPNGLVSAEASSSSLRQTCIKSALSKSEVIEAKITRPFKFPDGTTLRYIGIELGYEEMPVGCRGYIGRSSRPTLLVSRPNNPSKNKKIGINMPAYTSDEAGTNDNIVGTNDKGAIKCIKGRRNFKATLVITNKARNKRGKPIRVQRQRRRMKVHGRC